ncbi:MAG: orotate phosphoribosyltransferase [Coxiella sp. (in: Bacteria)]|nr:MAG: orotate phosphoribosyltransferase [Coxiella sp. (in: g-proteobacteria)]
MSTTAFIDFLLKNNALKFGEFTLKSGRISPYFFNLGVFNTGESLHQLGQFYAQALIDSGFDYDVLFGPAYKGIPLVSTTAISLYNDHQANTPYCFNRKEKKDHGDGGDLVGAKLSGNVVMFDDVITAGTTVRETIELVKQHDATLSGIVIAFDRQERGTGTLSAVNEVVNTYGIPVKSILTLTDVLQYLDGKAEFNTARQQVLAYYEQWQG